MKPVWFPVLIKLIRSFSFQLSVDDVATIIKQFRNSIQVDMSDDKLVLLMTRVIIGYIEDQKRIQLIK